MDYAWFLFRFDGRINRAKYWLATLVILCAMIAVLLSIGILANGFGIYRGPLAVNLIGISASIQFGKADAAAKASLFPHLVTFSTTVFFGWIYAATAIKRLHDRDKSGWWTVPFIVATGLNGQFSDWLGDSWFAVVVGVGVFVAFAWGMVEIYCLKGTTGPNRFGLGPLISADTRQSWDQQTELEFVPRSAGPTM
jgi:uncharacterized membrane protein YhaH (DUF805 family)